MRHIKAASPLFKFSPQAPGSCANILGFLRYLFLRNSARYISCACVCLNQGRKQLTQTVATEVTFINLYSDIAFENIMTSLAVNSRGPQ